MSLLQLALLIPLAGALLIVLARRRPALRDSITLATAVLLFAAVASLAPSVFNGARPAVVLAEP